MSSYDIKRNFDRAVHFVWNAADSQIYPELRRIEEQGLISSRIIYQDDKPNERVYRPTPQGAESLDAEQPSGTSASRTLAAPNAPRCCGGRSVSSRDAR